ncbi:MAG: hypothetical protein BWY52_00866 [Chloroflexi bacterium ADurb.Bin325]|nr:MAG: hypothetical protein BWY52_00866 [Chloroflexi bacterium ADurb.Bin325]
MKKGEKKKQQKALARRTKRKAAQKTTRSLTQVSSAMSLLREARSYPLLGCWAPSDWDQHGLAVVTVARRQPNNLVTFATFLVDYYCLGVKSAYFNVDVPHHQFMSEYLPKMMLGAEPTQVPLALAHELIYGSVEYAARWGFRPAPDFKIAQLVLDPPDAHPVTGQIEFGKDGKPLFISGPHDNVQAILHQLTRTAGEGAFHFMTAIDPSGFDFTLDAGEEPAE